jgi:tetratricopeptide (TPR) repeat protein
LLWAGLSPSASFAQAADDPHAACTAVGWVPQGLLDKPVALREGSGAGRGRGQVHDPVTTTSAEAQAFYDQGVAYLHSYVWIEAARAFRQALRLDSRLALAHLGLSRVATALEDKAAARRELELGEASPPRRARASGAASRCAAPSSTRSTTSRARRATPRTSRRSTEALGQDMDDVELWLLRGNAEEATAAGRGQRGGASSIAFYERALSVSPEHLAAHHYLVHSYEMIGRIDDALAHGEVYARLAPGVPHAHHMWAHDLRRVGRTRDAIAEFLKADALEKAYYAAEGVPAELDWHHQHNLDLLATSYQHQGQLREAERLMRQSFALPPPYEYSAFNKKEWPGFLLGRGRVEDAREAGRALVSSRFAAARAIGHVALAQAALATGALDAARAEAALAERETAAVEPGAWSTQAAILPYLDLVKGCCSCGAATRPRGARSSRTSPAAAGRSGPRRLDAGALRAGVDRPRARDARTGRSPRAWRARCSSTTAPTRAATTRSRSWPSSAATPRPRTSRSPPPHGSGPTPTTTCPSSSACAAPSRRARLRKPMNAGQRLGSYAIVAPLGAGGMGEVWRATDTKLHRDVAIKLLPSVSPATRSVSRASSARPSCSPRSTTRIIAAIHGLEEATAPASWCSSWCRARISPSA